MGDFSRRPRTLGEITPAPIVGNWILANCGGLAVGATAAAGLIRASPFMVTRAIRISELGARMTTGSSGGLCQLAIYANDPATKTPTGLPLAATGSISTTTAGALTADITGADVVLQPGFYWQAVNVDASGASAVFLGPAAASGFGAGFLGSSVAALAVAGNVGGANLTFTQSFGTWPNLTGVSPTAFSASSLQSPALLMKIA